MRDVVDRIVTTEPLWCSIMVAVWGVFIFGVAKVPFNPLLLVAPLWPVIIFNFIATMSIRW